MDIDSDENYLPSNSDPDVAEGIGRFSAQQDVETTPGRRVVPIFAGEQQTTGTPPRHLHLSSPGQNHQRKLKRHGSFADIGAPSKRQKRTFNAGYLELVNQDIQDASARMVAEGAPGLDSSQLGVTIWSHIEKEALFSALARLGRENLPAVAARIGTKGPLEVQQYLILLSQEDRKRRDDRTLSRQTVTLVDIPAAIEVSQQCCKALEDAADDLSLRQESHEISTEERRWGNDTWIVTADSIPNLVNDEVEAPPFAELFQSSNWLKLSTGVFMNSSLSEYNWRDFSDEPPSIWATAMSDFHALAVSVTKRLVAATLYMAASRIKARIGARLKTGLSVRSMDVRAAIDSLGMKPDSREFWARAARRIRLDVFNDDELWGEDNWDMANSDEEANIAAESAEHDAMMQSADEDESAESEVELMSYYEVEVALGTERAEAEVAESTDSDSPLEPDTHIGVAWEGIEDDNTRDEGSDYQDSEADTQDEDDEAETEKEAKTDSDADETDRLIDPDSVQRDLTEATVYSADFDGTTRGRNAIKARIWAEHRREVEAEMRDARNSAVEEARLWAVVQRANAAAGASASSAAMGNVKKEDDDEEEKDGGAPEETRKRWRYRDSGAVDWRAKLTYTSEWENKITK